MRPLRPTSRPARPARSLRLAGSLVAVAALGLSAALPGQASAAVPPVLQKPKATVTADALPTAQIDGIVWKQAIAGNTVFAGGQFTSARPAGAAPGKSAVRRYNLMSYDIRTGKMKAFAPKLNGQVRALATSPDAKILYVGGDFTKVGTTNRPALAAFSVATGKLLPLSGNFNNRVNAITTIGGRVYVGGWFTRVGQKQRLRVAALDAKTGGVTKWNPSADGSVEALVPTPDKTRVVIGGSFGKLSGKVNRGMGAVTKVAGTPGTWKANAKIRDYGSASAVLSLAADKDTVYGTGYGYNSGNFEGVFALNPKDGGIKWLQDCHGDQYGVAPVGDLVYSVGHAHFCRNIGGFQEIDPQRALVVSKAAKGTVATNTQDGVNYRNWQGYKAPAIYNWFPKLNTGKVSGSTQGAWSVAGTSKYVVLGGEFTTVNGKPQQGLTRFTTPANKAPRKMGPRATGAATTPSVWGRADKAGLQLGWNANYDLDDRSLRYQVVRDGKVLKTFTRRSTFWNRPWIRYADTTVKAGKTYTYQVRITDADGNRVTSPKVTRKVS
ncbi:hypothetical protein ACFFOM_11235 [Microlunatus capsulatus]|uniref:Rax2-like C-terminal domain-containing protein n=1 Tax=Microlunatus capsulatus TaxID=99117 RepID=A0ABS4Z9G0_9ACTN|nr:hypothetical protein [Microlunatus capsulatus]MBP2417683.1 hypothetical protein [Microlunatus capsulatus]